MPAAIQPDSAAAALPSRRGHRAPAKRPAVRIAQSPVRPSCSRGEIRAPAPVLESPADLLPDAAAAGVEQKRDGRRIAACGKLLRGCPIRVGAKFEYPSGARAADGSVGRTLSCIPAAR